MVKEIEELEKIKHIIEQPTNFLLQQQTLLPLLTQLKILSRNENHRQNMGEKVIASLICHISDQESGTKVQAEGANVILNLCYEKENVINVLNCGGASTLVFQQYSWNLLIIMFLSI